MSGLSEAGRSVRRRGFLDGGQGGAFQDVVLVSQLARLMEEAGEFGRSLRTETGPSLDELADVVIVCAAIAEHMGWDLDRAVAAKCAADEQQRGYRHGDGLPAHWYDRQGKALYDGRL